MIIGHSGTFPLDDETSDDDVALESFLDLLDRDIAARPQVPLPISKELFDRIEDLVGGMVVDPDEPIEGDVGL